MATETIISATFGAPGSGKTYSRVRWLVDDFLINNPSGMYITNIPLNIPEISSHVSRILSTAENPVSPEDIANRLHIIPDDVLIFWEKLNQLENRDLNSFTSETFPPSSYLQQFNLEGSHIAIDEFHKYFSKKGPKQLKKLWNDWFAEIRKTGCVFEAITQSYGQMSEEFLDKCATRLELINHSDLRDPLFKIKMGDWYELRAGLLGKLPLQRVSERETMRASSTSGRLAWKPTGKSCTFVLSGEYFRFYNSFRNYTGSSGVRKTPSEIYGKKIILWFLRRNFLSIFPRVLFAVVVAWFLLFGGFTWAFNGLFLTLANSGKGNNPNIKLSKSQNTSAPGKNIQPQNSSDIVSSARDHDVSAKNSEELQFQKELMLERERLRDTFKPAMFFDGLCVLRNQIEISEGFIFKGGVYDKRIVIKIESKKRRYFLDDGTCVSMF